MCRSKFETIYLSDLKQLIEECTLATIRDTHELMTGTETSADLALKCRLAGIFDVTDRIIVTAHLNEIEEE